MLGRSTPAPTDRPSEPTPAAPSGRSGPVRGVVPGPSRLRAREPHLSAFTAFINWSGLVDLAPRIKKTIITFMRVKSGIMAATTVVLSLIEGISAVR